MEAYLLIAPAWFNQALCLPLLGKCLASRKPKPAGFLSPGVFIAWHLCGSMRPRRIKKLAQIYSHA